LHASLKIEVFVGVQYIKYWKNKREKLENEVHGLSLESLGSLAEELIKLRNIDNEILNFITVIKTTFTLSLAYLKK